MVEKVDPNQERLELMNQRYAQKIADLLLRVKPLDISIQLLEQEIELLESQRNGLIGEQNKATREQNLIRELLQELRIRKEIRDLIENKSPLLAGINQIGLDMITGTKDPLGFAINFGRVDTSTVLIYPKLPSLPDPTPDLKVFGDIKMEGAPLGVVFLSHLGITNAVLFPQGIRSDSGQAQGIKLTMGNGSTYGHSVNYKGAKPEYRDEQTIVLFTRGFDNPAGFSQSFGTYDEKDLTSFMGQENYHTALSLFTPPAPALKR